MRAGKRESEEDKERAFGSGVRSGSAQEKASTGRGRWHAEGVTEGVFVSCLLCDRVETRTPFAAVRRHFPQRGQPYEALRLGQRARDLVN